MRAISLILLVGGAAATIPCSDPAQARGRQAVVPVTSTLLVPDRVWDGVENAPHNGWAVLVTGNKIIAAGPRGQISVPAGATTINLPGTTLMPGLIDAHSHVLLHPYNEASWNDQVLHESLALRTARAVNHLRATLLAGFTTIRDLGTEGAGYADVGLKQAVNQGIIPGPRMFVSTRAIVATGAYGPAGFTPEYANDIPQGGQEASGLGSGSRCGLRSRSRCLGYFSLLFHRRFLALFVYGRHRSGRHFTLRLHFSGRNPGMRGRRYLNSG